MRKPARKILLSVFAGLMAWSLPGSTLFAQSATGATAAAHSADEVELLALDQRIADAVVRGDTAYVDRMTAADFVMVHGDAWTRGGAPLLTDGKEALLRRVASKYYDVLDFDSVQVEMHGNVAITIGHYFAHTTGGNDPNRAWFSVWFERVYAKRDGRWTYLSHRTVHGPHFGPDRESINEQDAPATAQATPSADAAAAELLALERSVADAIVRGDTAYFDRVTSADFVMVHGDAWTRGGKPTLVDDKTSFMRRVANKQYAAHDYDVQVAEMHGDVAVTYGRYVGHIPGSPEGRRWFYVWHEKVYAKRDGQWVYLSHRTVDGAHYALDRESLRHE